MPEGATPSTAQRGGVSRVACHPIPARNLLMNQPYQASPALSQRAHSREQA